MTQEPKKNTVLDLTDTAFGQYHIDRQIGQGGTAFVYKAHDLKHQRPVALKILSPHHATNTEFGQRFEREARTLESLNHDHILPVYEFGHEANLSYIAMKYVDGGTLKDHLAAQSLDLPETARIITEIATALDHAHQRGILHRDIKPSNVLLADHHQVQLTDFGLMKLISTDVDELTNSGLAIGTPAYMSPEQGQGFPVDHHTDIYALGIILYQMLTGRLPFQAESPVATIFKHIHSPVPPPRQFNSTISQPVEAVIYKALAKAVTDRYHTAGALAQDLHKAILAADTPVSQHPANPNLTIRLPAVPSGSQSFGAAYIFHNLPSQPTPFVGRAKERADIAAHLAMADCRLLNLVGPGGIGKTRLAIQAAYDCVASQGKTDTSRPVPDFPNGVYFVSLIAVHSKDQLIPALADTLNFAFYNAHSTDQTPLTQLINYLREKKVLIILDNFEHLLEASDLLREILRQAPGVKFLVTSRTRLNLRPEWVFEIGGLGYPQTEAIQNVEQFSAVQLFLQNAARTSFGYTLSEEDKPHLIRICQLVAGMPLGLELASFWVRLLSCEEIAAEIEENLDFLAASTRDMPERHQSLRGVFEHSWNQLSEIERIVFRKLSVFRGGFSRRAAEEITGASLVILSGLVDKSFLRLTTAKRYETHESLRQFAAEKLADAPQEYEQAWNRYGRYFAAFLQERAVQLRQQQQQQALQEIGLEIENIRAAWTWILNQGQTTEIGKALDGLYQFYLVRSWLQEGVEVFGRAAQRIREAENMMHAFENDQAVIYGKVLARQGFLYYRLQTYGRARELLQKSLIICQHLQAPLEIAFCLNGLGSIAHMLGEPEEARQLYEQSLALYRDFNDRSGIASALINIGKVTHELHGQAKQELQESLYIFQTLGDQWGIARALNQLGLVAFDMGDYEEAQALYEQSLAICRQIDDQHGIARSLTNLASIAHLRGQYVPAQHLYQESLTIFADIGDQRGQATCLAHLGEISRVHQSYPEAKALLQQSLEIRQKTLNQHDVAPILDHLGLIAYAMGDYDEAKSRFSESLALNHRLGNRWGIVASLNHLGKVACQQGEQAAAKSLFDQALQIALNLDARPQVLDILVGIAQLWAAIERKQKAVSLLAFVYHQLMEDKETENRAARLRAEMKSALAPHIFAAAWAEGEQQCLNTVIADILEGASLQFN